MTDAKFAVVENVAGLAWLDGGQHLQRHLRAIGNAGRGYVITYGILDAQDYGVPAKRKRLFLVAVRADLGVHYQFPSPTHGPKSPCGVQRLSHGDAISQLRKTPSGNTIREKKNHFLGGICRGIANGLGRSRLIRYWVTGGIFLFTLRLPR